MSPMEKYVQALVHQIEVAKAFFFGRIVEGMEGLIRLPDDIRLKIDQLLWEAAGGKAVDPTDENARSLIAAAIMHSLEDRMGF